MKHLREKRELEEAAMKVPLKSGFVEDDDDNESENFEVKEKSSDKESSNYEVDQGSSEEQID